MKKNIFWAFIIFALFSCGKKQEIKISAVNPVTGEVYAGLKYEIIKETTGAFQENYKTVAQGTLNENGQAIESLRLKNSSYLIRIETPENNCYKVPHDITFAKGDKSFDFKFELAPCASYKKKITNINCLGSSDYFVLYYMGRQLTGNEGLVGKVDREGQGCFEYESTEYSHIPIGAHYYKWEVTRNGSTDTFYDTLYLEAGEYKTYEINY
jgi:hypothetical protein